MQEEVDLPVIGKPCEKAGPSRSARGRWAATSHLALAGRVLLRRVPRKKRRTFSDLAYRHKTLRLIEGACARATETRIRGSRTRKKNSEEMGPQKNHSGSSTHRLRRTLNWVRLPIGVGALVLAVSCRPSSALAPALAPAETSLAPMLVADLGVDIIVEDIDVAQRQLDFVRELGGHITAVSIDDQNGTNRMTVELRVPHEHTARVADILSTEFGEVTYINVFSADVSVRNARLRRELVVQEESLGDRSGTELTEAIDRIELLHDSIEFQLERAAFLFVVVHLVESR